MHITDAMSTTVCAAHLFMKLQHHPEHKNLKLLTNRNISKAKQSEAKKKMKSKEMKRIPAIIHGWTE